jgi:predicted phosphohydrolase
MQNYTIPQCDVVILAGDIDVGFRGVTWADKTFGDIPTIYIAGNHEYYGGIIPNVMNAMKAEAIGTNVHVLDNESIVINGVRFIGSTLWTDFDLMGQAPVHMLKAQMEMNDYRRIKISQRVALTANDTQEFHKIARAYLTEELFKPFEGPTVVVTHHLPSELSVPERFAGDSLNPAYASRLENLILDTNPNIWCHGHTHDNFDYMLGDTRIICNPRGYQGHELNPNFNPSFVIEVNT